MARRSVKFSDYRNILIVLITPLLLSPLLVLTEEKEAKCAFVVLLMAVYWITEAMPLAVTAFMPTYMFPLLGILSALDTCINYLKDANFLFVGGIMVAIATEECNLHKRIALKVLLKMGSQPRWLMLGFMLPSAFLSMWMSNVATVAMMAPIATCVLTELINHSKNTMENTPGANTVKNGRVYDQKIPLCKIDFVDDKESESVAESQIVHMDQISHEDRQKQADAVSMHIQQIQHEERDVDGQHRPHVTHAVKPTVSQVEGPSSPKKAAAKEENTLNLDGVPAQMRGLCKGILLSICFAASLGGTGTLTGTGPNIVLTGQLSQFYPTQTDVTFASWMAFAIPPMIVGLFVCWIVLLVYFVGWRSVLNIGSKGKTDDESITKILRMRYEELGELSFAEISIIAWFLILVFLWVFRDPVFIPGWESWFNMKKGFNSDAVAGMLVASILFVWPNQSPFAPDTGKKRAPLMSWAAVQRKFPWGVVMLLGGGYAMAAGVKSSGLDKWLGNSIQSAVGHLTTGAIAFTMACIMAVFTQIASNSAVATIFIPVLASMADLAGVNPLYYILPATVAASYAFTLPVSTPPNAVIFELKAMRLMDMIVSGGVLTVACVGILMLNLYTVGDLLFVLDTAPQWAGAAARGTANATLGG